MAPQAYARASPASPNHVRAWIRYSFKTPKPAVSESHDNPQEDQPFMNCSPIFAYTTPPQPSPSTATCSVRARSSS
jgi:hypothetical protein